MLISSRKLYALIALAVLLLSGCATLPPPPIAAALGAANTDSRLPAAADLVDSDWRLVEIRQPGVAPLVAADPDGYTVHFSADGRFSGQLSCNRMNGSYEVKGDTLVFGPIASTMAFCPDDGILATYSAALNGAVTYTIQDGQLVVGYGEDGGELVYAHVALSAAAAPTLHGVMWQLQAIHLESGESFRPGEGEIENLLLGEDGKATGQADCNRFNGSYTLDNGLTQFGPLMTTRAACPPGSLSGRFLDALTKAAAYGYDGQGNLRITFGPGANSLEFMPAPMLIGGGDVSEADLSGGVYQGIFTEPVTLTGGVYQGEPFVAGGASRPTLTLLPEMTAFGDLTGDGAGDGVAVLVENSGGSGSFVYLAAVASLDGAPINVATLLLGDRVRVESVTISGGAIEVVAGTFAENDPMCCPSQRTRTVYRLEQGTLVQISSEKL